MNDQGPGQGSIKIDSNAPGSTIITGDNNTIYQAPPGMFNLPQPPADFVGRAEELKTLRAALGTQGVLLCGLRGLGGVGKTALALVLADELRAQYPDAQMLIDLRGTEEPARAPEDAMALVLRAFFPTTRLPENPEELHNAYCTVLAGKKVLLLLDNARDAHQVRPLLPPAGSKALVTSRAHFSLDGLHELDLDALAGPDALALLEKLTGAQRLDGLGARLAELCGRLPLALRAAGSLLAERADLSAAQACQRLEESQARLKLNDPKREVTVAAALSSSYDLLPAELQSAWRRLGVFGADFDLVAAGAVWETTPETTQNQLAALRGYSLVEYEGGRWRLHDLARDFALAQIAEPERRATLRSHAVHYLEVLRQAKDLYKQGNEHVAEGLGLYDREQKNIAAGQGWAARAGDPLANAYPDAGVYVLSLRLHPREQIRWLEAGLAAARRLGDRSAEGAHLGNLGTAYKDLGEPRRAIEYYEQQLQITRQIGDRHGEGAALGNLGIAYKELGEPHHAIEYYDQVLQINREMGNRQGEGATLGNLGIAYYNLGEPRRAIEYHEQALILDREIGNRHGEGADLGNLGLAYADLGEPRRAIEYYQQQLQIARQTSDQRGEGNALGGLGNAYADLGNSRRAIEYYEQCLSIARETGDRHGEGVALGNLGIAYEKLGELDNAIGYYEQDLQITRQIGDRQGEAICSWNLGLLYKKRGEYARAAQFMQVCVDFYTTIGHPKAEELAQFVREVKARSS